MDDQADHGSAAKTMTKVGFSEAAVETDGFRIRYREAGSGPVVVCLHGAAGLRISKAHELMAAKHRVVVLEMPGFGASPVNERSATLRDLAATMSCAVAALGIQRYNLWGNSFGAKVALQMAVDNPAPLETLILVSPAAIRLSSLLDDCEPTPGMLYAYPERQVKTAPIPAEISEKQRALVRRLSGPPRDEPFEAQLPGLEVPTLIVFGTRDRMTPPETGRLYRELMPKSNLMMVYDAAHAVDAERPEAVVEVVADYIERQDSFVVTRANGLILP